MARKSTVTKLDARLREAVDGLVRDGRYTLDEILDHLAQLNGGTAPVSRSALGRYAQQAEEQMKRYREAQNVAKVWIGRLEDEPDGDVARLLPEMLRTIAYQTMNQLGSSEAGANPQEVMFLSKALADLGKANTAALQIELKLREIRAKAKAVAEEVASAVQQAGMGADEVDFWRKKVLGIV